MENDKCTMRRRAMMQFGVLAAAITLYFVFLRFDAVAGVLQTVTKAIQPVVIGFVLAYILRPVAVWLEKKLSSVKPISKVARGISIALTMIATICIIWAFCAVVIPQLVESVGGLIAVLPEQMTSLEQTIEEYLQTNEEAAAQFAEVAASVQQYLTDWVQKNLLGSLTAVISNVMGMVSAVISLILSLIVSLYLLLGWERYGAQCRKLFLAYSRNEAFNRDVFESLKHVNGIFNGYIIGKILDSAIVGAICFVGMMILRMPYAILISVIVGVTNVIPVFGPFIGAIPSAFLILLVSPAQCVAFLVFILILQQADGNIIGPHILGDSTGLSALYVTIAILLFGKLLGFVGMLIGVPVFATLYYLVKRVTERRLKARNEPWQTEEYMKNKEK